MENTERNILKPTKTTSIELMRIIAALVIMLAHFNTIYTPKDYFEDVKMTFTFVEFFLLLSGFFMMKHLTEKEQPMETFSYVLHKAKSFFGAYAIVFCVQFIFFTIANDLNSFGEIFKSLFHFKWEFLLLHMAGFNQDPQFNIDYLLGQSWYLSVMLISLLLLYPIARYAKKAFLYVVSPLSVIVIYGYIIQTAGTLEVGNEYFGIIMAGVLRGIAGTCMGCLCYVAYDRLKKKNYVENHRSFFVVTEVLCYLLIVGIFTLGDLLEDQDSLFYVLVFSVFLLLGFLNRTPISSFLNSHGVKALTYLGRMSLYLYLAHWSVLIAMETFMPELPLWRSIFLFLAVSFVYAQILKTIEEKRKTKIPVIVICVISIIVAFAVGIIFN